MVLLLSPRKGYLRHQTCLEVRIGGAEANTAIALARLGFSVGFFTFVGQDELGDVVLHRLRAEGLQVFARRVDAPTGLYIRENLAFGGRVYYYRQGSAAAYMAPEAFDLDCLGEAKIFHLSGITLALSERTWAFSRWLLQEAKERKMRVSLDVNYRKKLWAPEDAKPLIEDVLPLTDILFLSEDDAVLWPGDRTSILYTLAAKGPAEVVLKRGKKGAVALVEGSLVEADPFPVNEIDSVGAGDAFNAGYLAGVLWQYPAQERLKLGNAMGALAVTTLGDYEGAPSREDLFRFLGKSPILDR